MKRNQTIEEFNSARYSEEWIVTPAERIRIKNILAMAGSGKRILDLGCYDGTITEALNKENRVYGVEISEAALKLAVKKGLTCLKADVNAVLPFKDDSFDMVVCAEVIEHIFWMRHFFGEIKRVLKNTGELLISTPNLASLGRRAFLLLGKNPLIETDAEGEAAGHVRYFVKDSLEELLLKYNFRPLKYCSDVVNFDNSGKHLSVLLAKIFPSLGKSIIIKSKNEK